MSFRDHWDALFRSMRVEKSVSFHSPPNRQTISKRTLWLHWARGVHVAVFVRRAADHLADGVGIVRAHLPSPTACGPLMNRIRRRRDRLQRRSATLAWFLTEGLMSENAVKLGKYKITEKDFGISFRDWNAAKEQTREAMIARRR